MCFIALVVEVKAVPIIGTYSNGISLGEGSAVDGPMMHPTVARKFLAEDKRHYSSRRPVELRDTMIAGIVVARHATLATRNTVHFEDLLVPVVNPWLA